MQVGVDWNREKLMDLENSMRELSIRSQDARKTYSKEDTMKARWLLAVVVAVILAVGGSVAPVFAGAAKEADPEQRIANQQKRIDQALQAKEITPDNAKTLQGGLDKIKEEMTRAKADGKITKEEKDKLNSMLDQNGELISKTREAAKKTAAATAPAKAAVTVAPAKPAATATEKTTTTGPAKPAATAPVAAPAKPVATPAPAKPAATPAPAKPAATPAPAAPKAVTPAPQDPAIQKAIADQENRIGQGVQSKQLTLEESKILEDNLDAIRQLDTHLRSDGNFTQADKDQVLKHLDQNSKMIQDKKNNPVKNMRQTVALKDRIRTIPERIARQQGRIDQGIKSKALTAEEAKILQDNLNYIKNEETRLQQDGKLTNQEKERLHILLDTNGDMIENKKSNPVKNVK